MGIDCFINDAGNGEVMKLQRLSPASTITIFAPRYHDKVILIAKWKVQTHNIVKITKSNSYNGEYYLSNVTISKYPIEKIRDKTGIDRLFYAVPLDELVVYEGRI